MSGLGATSTEPIKPQEVKRLRWSKIVGRNDLWAANIPDRDLELRVKYCKDGYRYKIRHKGAVVAYSFCGVTSRSNCQSVAKKCALAFVPGSVQFWHAKEEEDDIEEEDDVEEEDEREENVEAEIPNPEMNRRASQIRMAMWFINKIGNVEVATEVFNTAAKSLEVTPQ